MKNIRCHANVTVELNPRLNFITGDNGSGKSSILTAIRLALGMRVDKSSARADAAVGAMLPLPGQKKPMPPHGSGATSAGVGQ